MANNPFFKLMHVELAESGAVAEVAYEQVHGVVVARPPLQAAAATAEEGVDVDGAAGEEETATPQGILPSANAHRAIIDRVSALESQVRELNAVLRDAQPLHDVPSVAMMALDAAPRISAAEPPVMKRLDELIETQCG
eukprot:4698721-Prymnesium_polylepis.1